MARLGQPSLLLLLLYKIRTLLRRIWCLRRGYWFCKPNAYLAPFKPWLNPVSRRVVHSGRGHWRRKPDWVRTAVFDLALAMPSAGYRTIAHCFNLQQLSAPTRQAADGMPTTISKTFVAKLLTGQRAALAQARSRACKRTFARRGPIQATWGLDLTGLPLSDGSSIPVFGVIDHGSRAVLDLQPVATYNSLVLLGKLLITMGTVGKPYYVRSDNDAVFKTRMFRCILKLLGVRQQFTDLSSPWQNGRIERFWRTLKSELQTKAVPLQLSGLTIQTRMKFASIQAMQSVLQAFRFSYNAHRPHQSLQGATPAMVWNAQVEGARLRRRAKAPSKVKVSAPATRSRKPRVPPD